MAIDVATIGDNSAGVDIATQVRDNLTEKFRELSKRAADLAGMLERAPKTVDNATDADKISTAIRQCTAFIKLANETRIGEKEPFLTAERAVDGFFKSMGTPVETTKAALLRIRTDYDVAVETAARRAREEEAARARAEADRIAAETRAREEAEQKAIAAAKNERDRAAAVAAAEARRHADAERAAVAESRAEDAHDATRVTAAELTRTRTDTGITTSLRSEWVHEVVDAKKVPKKFMVPDDKLIRAAVKSAVTKDNACPLEIPGVRIFLKHVSQVR